MNYEQTIRQLKERAAFYTAAATALEKIHAHENGGQTLRENHGAFTAATPKRKRKSRTTITDDMVRATMHLSGAQAARELGCSQAAVSRRRNNLGLNKPNGSAGDPIAVVR